MIVGVFGSAFNPPTNGHIDIVDQALNHFDKIYLVPSYAHAFGKKMIDFDDRITLTKLAFEDFPKEKVEVTDIERSISKNEPIYTWQLLQAIEKTLTPEDSLQFICGPDNIKNIDQFARHELIIERWGIWDGQDRTGIRSTLVRDKITNLQPIDHLVPKKTKKLTIELYKNENN